MHTNLESLKPWAMCSSHEARDRELHMEISNFESTKETWNLLPSQRIADPMLSVKKYRRSAAGGGVNAKSNSSKSLNLRSIAELDSTVTHLLKNIFCHQKSHHEKMNAQSLSNTAAFVDDRIRAVQVDCVMGHSMVENVEDFHNMLQFQSRIIRYNIVVGYLLSNPTINVSKFEHKFNAHALQSSFSTFFELFQISSLHTLLSKNERDENMDIENLPLHILDEVMCYSCILHLSSILFLNEEKASEFDIKRQCRRSSLFQGSSSSGLLSRAKLCLYFKKLTTTYEKELFPKWKWSLEVMNAADIGNFIRCLHLITNTKEKEDDEKVCNNIFNGANTRWKCLARCLLLPCLPLIRIGLLRQYNKSFGKAEKVSGNDVSVTTLTFCLLLCFFLFLLMKRQWNTIHKFLFFV